MVRDIVPGTRKSPGTRVPGYPFMLGTPVPKSEYPAGNRPVPKQVLRDLGTTRRVPE